MANHFTYEISKGIFWIKILYFHLNGNYFCLQGGDLQWVGINWDNGLEPNRWQTIIWTKMTTQFTAPFMHLQAPTS